MVATNTAGPGCCATRRASVRARGRGGARGHEEQVDELSVARKDNTGSPCPSCSLPGRRFWIVTCAALQVEPLPSEVACAWLAAARAGCADAARAGARVVDRLSAPRSSVTGHVHCARPRPSGSTDPSATTCPSFLGAGRVRRLVRHRGRAVDAPPGCTSSGSCSTRGRPMDAPGPCATASARACAAQGTVVGFDVRSPGPRCPCSWSRSGPCMGLPLDPARGLRALGRRRRALQRGRRRCRRGALIERLHVVFGLAVEEYGGSFSGEHGIGPVNASWWRRTRSPGSQRDSPTGSSTCATR